MSQALINFARTCNPSQPGLDWKPYTKDDPQAMVFDTVSQSVALRDDKLVSLLPAAGGRGGTAPALGGGTAPSDAARSQRLSGSVDFSAPMIT